MRTLSRAVTTLALSALIAACGAGGQDDDAAGGGPGAAATTITIALEDGAIVVTPDSVEVQRGAQVTWQSTPDVPWVVAFPGSTPFQNGRRIFFGASQGGSEAHGPIPPNAPVGSNKYTVFYPDSDSTYVMKDPKLIVVDDKGMGGDTTM